MGGSSERTGSAAGHRKRAAIRRAHECGWTGSAIPETGTNTGFVADFPQSVQWIGAIPAGSGWRPHILPGALAIN
jgi:hypothetical protein